jgi:hypothetical protein
MNDAGVEQQDAEVLSGLLGNGNHSTEACRGTELGDDFLHGARPFSNHAEMN